MYNQGKRDRKREGKKGEKEGGEHRASMREAGSKAVVRVRVVHDPASMMTSW